MAVIQQVQDGKLVDTSASTNSLSAVTETDNSALDKEAFLQLLVAQMKYQDPLEPTSNTEYISQLATFSSLEQMQNLNSTMETSQAADLVGKQVILKVTSKTGEITYVTGQVDYIVRENGNTYLSVNDGLYSLSDLDTVVDGDYLEATNIASYLKQMVAQLPAVNRLTVANREDVEKAREVYDGMTEYQKGFVEKDVLDALKKLEEKMEQLTANAGNAGEDTEENTEDTSAEAGTEA